MRRNNWQAKKRQKINQKLSPCQHCVMTFFLINCLRSRRYLFYGRWLHNLISSIVVSQICNWMYVHSLGWRSQWFAAFFSWQRLRVKTANLHNARNKSLWQHLSKGKLSTLTYFAMAIKYAIRFERHRARVVKLCKWNRKVWNWKTWKKNFCVAREKTENAKRENTNETKCNKSQINIKSEKSH